MTIIGTGLNGLVGSKLSQAYEDKYSFLNIDRLDPVSPIDITDYDQLAAFVSASDAPFIIHFAAFTDVTKAWEQRGDTNGVAYQVNVVGTQNMVKVAEATGKQLVHISTAYVFDGEKEGSYTESDSVHPIEWYGETKAKAEEAVFNSTGPWTVLRIDQPFRSNSFPKVDVAHRIKSGLAAGTLYPQFVDHYIGPTFIDDFVKVLEWVIRTKTTGLFHATAGEKVSDYEFATLINNAQNLGAEVKKGQLSEYLKTLNRPYQKNTALNCEKLTSLLDFRQMTLADAVKTIQ